MFERFTHGALQTVTDAQLEARALRHDHVGTEHILLGLLRQPDTMAGVILDGFGVTYDDMVAKVQAFAGAGPTNADALAAIGIDLDEVRRRAEETFGPGALNRTRAGRGRVGGHMRFTPRAKKVLELALREALALRHNYIGTEHILLGLLREGNGGAALALSGRDVTYRTAHQELVARLADAPGA